MHGGGMVGNLLARVRVIIVKYAMSDMGFLLPGLSPIERISIWSFVHGKSFSFSTPEQIYSYLFFVLFKNWHINAALYILVCIFSFSLLGCRCDIQMTHSPSVTESLGDKVFTKYQTSLSIGISLSCYQQKPGNSPELWWILYSVCILDLIKVQWQWVWERF